MSASALLMEIMVQHDIPEDKAQMIAERIVAEGVIDRHAVVRRQIQADPCRDYKVVMRRYHVGINTVYRSWAEIFPSLGTK